MKLSIISQGFESNSKSNGTKLKLTPEYEGGWDSIEPKISKLKLKSKFNIEGEPKPLYQGPTAADTILYTPRTHVYKRPEMWMGANADIFIEEEIWLYNTRENKIYKKIIRYVPGVERIFIEIAANAADNGCMSRRMGGNIGELEITMNNSLISIKNSGGFPMPVELHPHEPGKYVPEVSFGRLLTSRHYDAERNESGTNGVGSKATNIFSKEFTCIVLDNVRHLKYTQNWFNNMQRCDPPLIEEYKGKIASVEIIYKMDFTRFGYPEPNESEGGYPEELIHLFARHASDISFTAKMPVTFNGIKFNNSNLRDYGRLYFGDLVDSAVIHYQWPPGTEVIKKKKGHQVSKDPAILPIVELLALDTPDSKDHLSFANSLMTKNGGIHVNAAIKAVADSTVKMINEEMTSKMKGKKSKDADSKDKKIPTITINDVKPHISILLSVKVTNPKFDGQEKTKLLESKPPPKINISDESLKIVARWKLVDRLYLALEAKQMNSLKGNGKMQANVRTKKGTKANKAGGPESHKCTLYITEGDSGDLYVETLTTLLPGGSNYAGRLPMKGKSLNSMNATIFEILRNPEFNQLNKMLGLIPGADYMDDAFYNKLRYGALMIAADSDVDGKHITGLILLYFHRCFPALLARGFILNYLTPIVGVRYKGHFYKFYSQVAYENWMRATPDSAKISADDHKYYKGLASSEDPDIEADFKDPHIINCFYDIDAPDALSLAFAKGREDERKEWLTNWKALTEEPKFIQQPISWFINNELILHSWDNVLRTLPRLMDGLKEGHRKIIYAMHLQWAIGSKKRIYKEEKVGGFAGYVGGHTAYHHGEMILAKTIVGMAQDFIGSNNIPYLAKKGQFGCFDPETPILLWDGSTKLAKNITIEDKLVGDDGNIRNITALVDGYDDMYDIVQNYDATYRVNSEHILTLYLPTHKHVTWRESSKRIGIEYFDVGTQKIAAKSFNCDKMSKEEGQKKMKEFALTIPDNKIFDINLQTFLSYSKSRKELFRSVRNNASINWSKQDVPIDPYCFGMWLGDGQKNGRGFASEDQELVKEWVKYLDKIGVEVVHNKNKDGHEGYQYGFRRRGASTGLGDLIAVGHEDHSSKTCNGCLTSQREHPACDWIYEDKNNENFREYDGIAKNGMVRNDMNPFVNILKKYDLHENKFVPNIYMINDEETRLQLLAGLIDTDGCLKKQDIESSQIFEITQDIKTHEQIIDAAQFIAKSLGYKTFISMNGDQKCLTINGDLSRIPTRLPRKQATKKICRLLIGEIFEVRKAGEGYYVGWHLDGNERFLHADFTVLHNTRSKIGRKAGQPRYIHTYPMPIVASIYDKKDAKILKYQNEEGKIIEPEQYLPKVPMILINGATGIGTGWSSYTPPHDPLDILKCLRILLHGGAPSDLPRLIPWFRNFLGTIEIINRKTKNKIIVKATENKIVEEKVIEDEDDDSNTDESHTDQDDDLPEEFTKEDKEDKDAKKQLYSMKITGNFEVLKNGNIVVTELPIGRAPFDYHKWLEKLVDEKKIKGFDDNCAKDIVSFTIVGYKGTPTHKNLLLEKVKGLSNMFLLDENNKPKKYDDGNHILIEWFGLRLPFYQVRKDYMVQKIADEIITMNYKILFYTEVVIKKTIELVGVKRSEVHAIMDKLEIPREIYTGGKLPNLSIEGIEELHAEILLKQQEKEDLEKISIQQMMLTDLDEFEKVYRREFKIKDKIIKLKVGGSKKNTNDTKTIPLTKAPVVKFPTNNGTSGKTGKPINRPKLIIQ